MGCSSGISPTGSRIMRARLERVASRIAPPIEEETSLEAPDQTWRIVDVDGKPPEYPKVKSLVRW